jgi:hypothetical protein
MPYQVYPEYEFFTGVEIKFSVDGDAAKTFVISKLGEHFQGLTVTEGSVSGDKQVSLPNGNHLSNGTLTLLDEDNSIFLSLISSKSSQGNPLVNKVDITLNTYTGSRRYADCRVDKWSCSFSDGVPTITINWQGFPSGSQPSKDNTQEADFDTKLATEKFVDIGILDFKGFKDAIKEVFTTQYTFVYSDTREYTDTSLKEIGDDGSLKVFTNETGDKGTLGYIFIPESCRSHTNANEERLFRMELKGSTDNYSFLNAILGEFCKTAKITLTKGIEKDNLGLGFLVKGNNILLYSYTDVSRLTMPQPMGTAEILNNTVFVYNSSLRQGEIYTTPQGDKRVFAIESISTTFEMKDIIKAALNNQSNANNPNGNFIMTSRGSITLPADMPQAISQSIQNLAGLTLSQDLQVTIDVSNFIHFYCLGETPVYLIVFDHKGNIHPLSGRMKIGSYSYTLGVGGVIKAKVTLTPVFSSSAEDYVAPVVGEVSGSNTSHSNPMQSTLPNSSASSSYSYGDYPYNPSTSQGSYVHTGMTLDSAIDYTITKAEGD